MLGSRVILLTCALMLTTCVGGALGANFLVVPPGTPGVTPTSPYATWVTASTDLVDVVRQASVSGASNTVAVSNGVYSLTNLVDAAFISLTSLYGAAQTVLTHPATVTHRVVTVSTGSIDGFTVSGGDASLEAVPAGGGLFLNMATGRNCIVQGNMADTGGGLMMANNSELYNCLVVSNLAATAEGGGVYLRQTANRIRNCTIVSNVSLADGGGVFASNSLGVNIQMIENSIVFYNMSAGLHSNVSAVDLVYTNCCLAPDTGLTGSGNLTNEPGFVSRVDGDYRLTLMAPCVNAGTNREWMTNAVDVAGHRRILNDRVDIGAYETRVAPYVGTSPSSNSVVRFMQGVSTSWTFQVQNTGDVSSLSFDYAISLSNLSELVLNVTNGTNLAPGGSQIVIVTNTAGLPAGDYTGSVVVAASNAFAALGADAVTQAVMTLRLIVDPRPQLVLSPISFSPVVLPHFNPSGQVISVWNGATNGVGGYYPLGYAVSSDVPWLVAGTGGVMGGASTSSVPFTYQTTTFASGVYTGRVWFHAWETNTLLPAQDATQSVEVTLSVLYPPTVGLSQASVSQTIEQGASASNLTMTLWNSAAAPRTPMRCVLSDDSTWVSPSVVSFDFSANESQTFVLLFDDLSGFGEGLYTANVTLTAVDSGTTYDGAGTVTNTTVMPVSIQVTTPIPPTGLTASKGIVTNAVDLSWDVAGSAASYEVWRHTTSASNAAERIITVLTNVYSDASALPGTHYYYWIKSVNLYGYAGAFGTPDSGYWESLNVPGAVSAGDGDFTDKIRLTWVSPMRATGCKVYRNLSPSAVNLPVFAVTTGTTFDDTSATPGLTYYYFVQATNAFGSSGLNAAEPGYRKLLPPSGVTATAGSYTDKVRVAGSAVQGATSYSIFRSTESDPVTARIQTSIASRIFDDTAAVEGVIYYYWLRANALPGNSDLSGSVQGYRQLGAPGSLSASAGTYTDKIRLSWSAVASVASYQVWRGTNAAMAGATLLNETGLTSYDDVSSASGAFYYYWILSRKGQVLSGPGPVAAGWRRSLATGSNVRGDFDGDRRWDPAVYQESTGLWSIRYSSQNYATGVFLLGGPGHRPVSGDYDGDGRADLAVYGQSSGIWYARLSASGYGVASMSLGGINKTAVAVDYDGDGKTDPGVYDPVTGAWQAWLSGSGYASAGAALGGAIYAPAPGDYDGDGRADPAVYQARLESSAWVGYWLAYLSGRGYVPVSWNLGGAGFVTASADYDGDSILDSAVYQESTGLWNIKPSSGMVPLMSTMLGGPGFQPAPGDYDGDARADVAVYETATGTWYVYLSASGGALAGTVFGGPGLEPIRAAP